MLLVLSFFYMDKYSSSEFSTMVRLAKYLLGGISAFCQGIKGAISKFQSFIITVQRLATNIIIRLLVFFSDLLVCIKLVLMLLPSQSISPCKSLNTKTSFRFLQSLTPARMHKVSPYAVTNFLMSFRLGFGFVKASHGYFKV